VFNRQRNRDGIVWRKHADSAADKPDSDRGGAWPLQRAGLRLITSVLPTIRHVWLAALNIEHWGKRLGHSARVGAGRLLIALLRSIEVIAENLIEQPLRRFIGFVAVLWGLAGLFSAFVNGFDAKSQAALWIAGGIAVLALLPVPHALTRLFQGHSGATYHARSRRRTALSMRAPSGDDVAAAPSESRLQPSSLTSTGILAGLIMLVLIGGVGYGIFAGIAKLRPFIAGIGGRAQLTGFDPGNTISGRGIALGGNRVRIGDQQVQLFGIVVPARDEKCEEGSRRRAWACGRLAQSTLTKSLAGRTARCTARGATANGLAQVVCRIGEAELNAELIRAGAARVASGDPAGYASLETAARASGAGIWRGQGKSPADAKQD